MKLRFCLRFLSLFVFLCPVAGEGTRLAFHSFSAEDDDFITLGDAVYSGANQSYIINTRAPLSRQTCGVLLYGKKVRIKDVASGRVASFSTSFSFTFDGLDVIQENQNSIGDNEESSVSFAFIRDHMVTKVQDFVSKMGSSGGCKSPKHPSDPNHRYSPPSVIVVFGMGKYYAEDTSNCYIRVAKSQELYEYDVGAHTHNLCGNKTHCSYFSDGKIFTAWIDFNSSVRTLEVRLVNGSNPGVKKPLQPQLRINNYTMPGLFGDHVHPSFWATSDAQRVEGRQLLSWSFSSTEISKVPHSHSPNRIWKVRTWAGFSTGVLGVIVAAAVVILWSISRLGSASRTFRYTPLGRTAGPHVFSYAELRKATHDFHERNLLGTGGSGSVYKGSFEAPNGVHFVAVKQINISQPKQAESLFQAEVASLGQIRHRNVVQLQGWCQEKGRLLLVYDFMPNGGLDEWLHSRSADRESGLSLRIRHSILEGVGSALEYLHEDCSSCVLHRDIKSSNVLLDADFVAHLGDFGLARLMDRHKLDKTTLAAGTLGYMAPELPYTGKATKESDVYSFGILLLEVVCGRRPLDMRASEPEDLVLLQTVWRAHEGKSLLNIVDPKLLQTLQPIKVVYRQEDEVSNAARLEPPSSLDFNIGSGNNVLGTSTIVDVDVEVYPTMVVDLLRLGLLCCLPNPKARPSMGEVNGILQQIRDMENLSTISNIAMPSLPSSKPLGLYQSLEFSQTSLSLSSNSSSISKANIEMLVNNSSFANLHKGD